MKYNLFEVKNCVVVFKRGDASLPTIPHCLLLGSKYLLGSVECEYELRWNKQSGSWHETLGSRGKEPASLLIPGAHFILLRKRTIVDFSAHSRRKSHAVAATDSKNVNYFCACFHYLTVKYLSVHLKSVYPSSFKQHFWVILLQTFVGTFEVWTELFMQSRWHNSGKWQHLRRKQCNAFWLIFSHSPPSY